MLLGTGGSSREDLDLTKFGHVPTTSGVTGHEPTYCGRRTFSAKMLRFRVGKVVREEIQAGSKLEVC